MAPPPRRFWQFSAAAVLLLLTFLTAVAQTPSTSPALTPAVAIQIHGAIDDYSASVVLEHIKLAQAHGAKTLIFDLDTPGGGLGATLDMTRAVRSLTNVHTIAYISPRAYSAGTIFAVACDEIYMSTESAMGDCAPIMVTDKGIETLGDAERAKASSPVVADMKASADRNGYDPELLAAMVLPKRTVHVLISPEGTRKIVDEDQYKALITQDYKPYPNLANPLDGPDTLLTLSGNDAERVGLSKGTYPTIEALAAAKSLTILETLAPTAGQHIVQFLNSSVVRGLLVSIFLMTLYLSFNIPGHGLPEAACLSSLATLIIVPLLTGYASWFEILLILLGIVLIALEIFVVTGTIIPGVIGAILVLAGLILTFVPRELPTPPPGTPGSNGWGLPSVPTLPQTWTALETGFGVVLAAIVISTIAAFILAQYLPAMPYGRRLVLSTIAGSGGVGSLAGRETEISWPAVGQTALTTTDLRPSGNAQFPDPDSDGIKTVPVVSDSGFVNAGTKVRVIEVAGPRVLVRAVPTSEQS